MQNYFLAPLLRLARKCQLGVSVLRQGRRTAARGLIGASGAPVYPSPGSSQPHKGPVRQSRFRPAGMAPLLCSFCAPLLAAPDMNPGLWEVTVQLESPGTAMVMPPITQTLCFSLQDVEAGGMTQPTGNFGQSSQCKPDNLVIGADSASFTLNCDGLSGEGHMTYNGDSYSGSADLALGLASESQRLKQTFNGRRLGDCQK